MAELHSTHIGDALVWWARHRAAWIDAVGDEVIKFMDDFLGTPCDDTTLDPNQWVITKTGSATGSDAGVGQESGGILALTTDGNENDGVNLQVRGEAFKFKSTNRIYFGVRYKMDEATQSDFFLGLSITDTSLLGGVTDDVSFRKVDGSTSVGLYVEKDNSETSVTGILTQDANAYHILEFLWDGPANTLKAFVDGVEQTAPALTNLPDDEELTPSIEFLSGITTGAHLGMTIDWVRAIQIGR